jgi:hypothetical protein
MRRTQQNDGIQAKREQEDHKGRQMEHQPYSHPHHAIPVGSNRTTVTHAQQSHFQSVARVQIAVPRPCGMQIAGSGIGGNRTGLVVFLSFFSWHKIR